MTPDQWLAVAIVAIPSAIGAIGAVAAGVLGLVNRGKLQRIHIDFNSRNDALLAANKRADLAEGKEQGGLDAAAIKAMIDQAIATAMAIPAALVVADTASTVAAALAVHAAEVAAKLKEANHDTPK